jgi:hypothetical protein
LLVGTVLLVTGPAVAQEIHPDCPEDFETEAQAQAAAGEWFTKGERLIEREDYDQSLASFLCAFALAPHPAPVFNAAQAALLGGKDSTAVLYFKQYLGMAPAGPMAEEARKQLAELEGPAPEPTPPPVTENAAAEPPPPAPAEADFDAPWEVPEEETPEEEPGPPGVVVAGWVFVGLGAAGVVTGAVLQGLAGKALEDGEAMNRYEGFEDQQAKVDKLQTGALVGFIAGGVLVGGGIAMIAIGGGGDDEGAVEVTVSPAPGGLSVGGTF